MHNKDGAGTCHQQSSLRSSCIPCKKLLGLLCCWRCQGASVAQGYL